MELSSDRQRFIKLSWIVLEIIPTHLRSLFIKKWDEQSSNQKWNSDISSGTNLFNKLSENLQKNGNEQIYISKIREGNEQDWDMTILGKVFLDYGLKLIDDPRYLKDRCSPFNDGEKVSIFRDIRNQYFAQLPSMSCLPGVFERIINEVKIAGDDLFEKSFQSDIDIIEHLSIKEEERKEIERLVTTAIATYGEDLQGVQGLPDTLKNDVQVDLHAAIGMLQFPEHPRCIQEIPLEHTEDDDLPSHSTKIQNLESDFHKLKEEKSSHSAKIQNLESDFHKLKEEKSSHSAKIQNLESDFHKLKEEKSSHSAKIQNLESDFHKLKEEKSSQKFTGCTFNGPYIENLTTNDTYNHMGHNIDTPTNYMSLNNFATGNQGNVALPQEERPQIENNGGDGSQEHSDGGSDDTVYHGDGTKDLR